MIAIEYLPYHTVHLARAKDGEVWGTTTPCGLSVDGAALWQLPPTPGRGLTVCRSCLRAVQRPMHPPEIMRGTYFMPLAHEPQYIRWRVTFKGYAANREPTTHEVEVTARDGGEARSRARLTMDDLFGQRMWRWEVIGCRIDKESDDEDTKATAEART